MRNRPLLEQLERQNNVTRALLPFVSALPFVDADTLAEAMTAVRKWKKGIQHGDQ